MAATLHQQGKLTEAVEHCESVLGAEPRNVQAWNLLGVIRGFQGQFAAAVDCFARAVALDPRSVQAHRNLALTYVRLGRHDAAVDSYRAILALQSGAAEVHADLGSALMALGRFAEAAESFRAVVAARPGHVGGYRALATALAKAGRAEEAATSYRAALALEPDDAETRYRLGAALFDARLYEEAIAAFHAALDIDPGNATGHIRIARAHQALRRTGEAIAAYRRAIALKPDFADAHFSLGNTYSSAGRHEEAMASFQAALAAKPDFAEAANNLGVSLGNLGRIDSAMAALRRAIAIKPDHAGAHNNLGNALSGVGRFAEAIDSFHRTLAITPERADIHSNLGNALVALHRYDEGLASFRKALRFDPLHPNAFSQAAHVARLVCDWSGSEQTDAAFVRNVVERGLPFVPFPLLSIADDPDAQYRCARQYWAHRKIATAPAAPAAAAAPRLRVGYISADFCAHPVASLTARLFELHDRDRFEVFAFAHGRNDKSAMRRRLERGFDGFFDIWKVGDEDAARQIRAKGVDILVDLTGHTSGGRLEILARRPAPVQVHYLGYPGTLGVDFIDYMLVDRFIAPPSEQAQFAEKLVYLPDSFQINDPYRTVSERAFTRADCGLPERGFVFCCFNHGYKLTPRMFDIWCRLLKALPDSVLWMSATNRWAQANLRREAQARGVDPERVIFAPRLESQAEHLARYRLAGLFLDTLPYNAHTTASDALCAGLPVLTCVGRSLAARVAGSLLHAVGLPELITDTLADYERLALRLATRPEELAALRAKLARNLPAAPLFDAERTTRRIEAAYLGMWDIYRRGEPPRSFAVQEP
jgi:predicted O-linked N-acetylglucosamine transferase (SPINDLY family)